MPPNIMFRFADDSKFKMPGILMDVEDAMLILSKFASTVVEGVNEQDALRNKHKWTGSVDICIMSKIFAVPKTQEGKTVDQQEADLREAIAELVAGKLLALLESRRNIRGYIASEGFFSALPKETSLMKMVHDRLADPSKTKAT